jgi:integrase
MFDSNSKPDWRQEFKRLEGAYSPNTLRSYLACFQSFEDWASERGYTPLPARPRQARGITPQTLKKMISVQPDNVTGSRNAALLQVGYEILARRSELTALKLDDVTFLDDGTAKIIIRRGKADPYGSGRSGHLSGQTVSQLQKWLNCRNPNSDWLFQPVYKNVSIPRSISYTTVKRVILKSLKTSGVDDVGAYSSHSLRVGAAQELLRRGHSTSTIMRAGGWKSVNVLARYLEEAEINIWN